EPRDGVALLRRVDPARVLARRERPRAGDRAAGGSGPGAHCRMSSADVSMLQRPNDKLVRRRAFNRGMEVLAWVAAALAVALLGGLVLLGAKRGARELYLEHNI